MRKLVEFLIGTAGITLIMQAGKFSQTYGFFETKWFLINFALIALGVFLIKWEVPSEDGT